MPVFYIFYQAEVYLFPNQFFKDDRFSPENLQ